MTRIGKYTIRFDDPPSVRGFAAIASKKEAEGPMAKYIDILNNDSMFGQQTWEKAESRMQQEVAEKALNKASLVPGDIGYLFAGDLLNQCIGSHYGLSEIGIPFLGLYSACATMAEGLFLSAVMVESAACDNAMAVTSSHFCSAERQYRFPLEYGGQRTPSSQWTVTGAGAAILGKTEDVPFIREASVGTMVDRGIKDLNNMGAAMAPVTAIIGPYDERLYVGLVSTQYQKYIHKWPKNKEEFYGNRYFNSKSKGRGRQDDNLRESWYRACASR